MNLATPGPSTNLWGREVLPNWYLCTSWNQGYIDCYNTCKTTVKSHDFTVVFVGQQIKAAEKVLENIKIYGNVSKAVIE